MNRRTFIDTTGKTAAGAIILSAAGSLITSTAHAQKGAVLPDFTQKPLPYAYNALESNIDALTMEIHYTKHAATYTKNMNDAIKEESAKGSLEDILKNISKYSAKLRNNAGGHYNHESFWQWMKPGGSAMPAAFKKQVEQNFGSVEDMKKQFADAATKRFGSGWAWLVATPDKKLKIGSTPNQDNPLMDVSELKGTPLLGLDVWEHAYYLKYQNKRADYITNWWNVVNWEAVASRVTA